MFRLFQKKINSKAQSTMEYTLIVTLVAVSIIIIGPYVIRSWNAYLKSTEASLQDSLQDPFEEADPGQFDLPSCTCGDWERKFCGLSSGGENCSAFERAYVRKCTGAARVCEDQGYDTFKCIQDSTCCTPWAEGPCGVNATPQCPDGEKQWARECGSYGNWEYECRVDPECDFHCEMAGEWPVPGSYSLCKDSGYDPDDESRLPSDINYTFVEDGGCNTIIKCEIECCPVLCPEPPEELDRCSDGTLVGYCSMVTVGYYCTSEAQLEPGCYSHGCGCSRDYYCDPPTGRCLHIPGEEIP